LLSNTSITAMPSWSYLRKVQAKQKVEGEQLHKIFEERANRSRRENRSAPEEDRKKIIPTKVAR